MQTHTETDYIATEIVSILFDYTHYTLLLAEEKSPFTMSQRRHTRLVWGKTRRPFKTHLSYILKFER